MKHKSKFQKQEREEQQIHLGEQSLDSAKDFESVEELLRFDASQTKPPESVWRRLGQSAGKERKSSWWSRVFGGNE